MDVTVEVSSAEPAEGESVTLTCNYNVTSAFILKWYYRHKDHGVQNYRIWEYNSNSKRDGVLVNDRDFKNPFSISRINANADVSKQHSIKLNSVALNYEGIFKCYVEQYASNYDEGGDNLTLTVIGM